MILTMIFMYEKRNRNYYFSIHLIFIVPIKSLNIIKNSQFTIFFLPFHHQRYILSEKNSKLRQF